MKNIRTCISREIAKFGTYLTDKNKQFNRKWTYTPEKDHSYARGATLVMDILKYKPEIIVSIHVRTKGFEEHYHHEVIAKAEECGIPIIYYNQDYLPMDVFGKYSVIAEISKWEDRMEPGNHLVFVNPAGSGNIGAILRSALALGVHDAAIISDQIDPFSPRVIRSSMGARLLMRVEVMGSFEEYMERFPENHRYAFMLRDDAKRLQDVVPEEPWTLIVGNETTGLPEEYMDLCQGVFIEQSDEVAISIFHSFYSYSSIKIIFFT